MESWMFSTIIMLAGIYFIIRNILLLGDENRLRAHLANSQKAKYWVSKYGMDRTVVLSKKYFVPFGVFTAVIIFGFGLHGLLIYFK